MVQIFIVFSRCDIHNIKHQFQVMFNALNYHCGFFSFYWLKRCLNLHFQCKQITMDIVVLPSIQSLGIWFVSKTYLNKFSSKLPLLKYVYLENKDFNISWDIIISIKKPPFKKNWILWWLIEMEHGCSTFGLTTLLVWFDMLWDLDNTPYYAHKDHAQKNCTPYDPHSMV